MAQDITPSFVANLENNIELTISSTEAVVTDQGYTYNQALFTYNQAGVMYGGISMNNQDIRPVFINTVANLINPTISSIIDTGGKTHYRFSVGPGWFMYVTHDYFTP